MNRWYVFTKSLLAGVLYHKSELFIVKYVFVTNAPPNVTHHV